MTGKDSKVSSLCHELTHLVRYGPKGMYGGMQSEDMTLFENAYNIERYFEID
ncbi:hypothetical protein SD15574_3137 [Shigella dysenteriae 155-74]|nr:conserved hypothetical protein [Shigella dysenteriae 1012]EGI94227.1 hypothetical protein SD15574_3137 [Shigella dysenteriae 155-74]EIQ26594.1 hypothetical protein SB96558_3564 [Shigella boydii 965-58]